MIELIITISGTIVAICIVAIILLVSIIKRDFNRVFKFLDDQLPEILTKISLLSAKTEHLEETVKKLVDK